MADDNKGIFDTAEDELESLGFSAEEIESIKQKVIAVLQDPELADALEKGEINIALTFEDFADELVGGRIGDNWNDEDGGFDWDDMTPEVRAAMEELYFSDEPPTLH
jgi:hypothetical protein